MGSDIVRFRQHMQERGGGIERVVALNYAGELAVLNFLEEEEGLRNKV